MKKEGSRLVLGLFEEIPNADLKEEDIPVADAEYHEITSFALTFDGYEAWGSFRGCAEVANSWADAYARGQELPDSLTELRTCLFFEQRRFRDSRYGPSDQAMAYIRALVETIRHKVRAGEVE